MVQAGSQSRSRRADVAATYPYVDKGPRPPRGNDRGIDFHSQCNRLARPPLRGYVHPRNAPLVRVFPSVRRQKRSSRSSVNAGAVCFCPGPLGTWQRYGSPAGPRKPTVDRMGTTEQLLSWRVTSSKAPTPLIADFWGAQDFPIANPALLRSRCCACQPEVDNQVGAPFYPTSGLTWAARRDGWTAVPPGSRLGACRG
jgi:hypothetical protein